MQFIHDAPGCRVVFGPRTVAKVEPELARLGARPLLIVDETVAQIAASSLPALRRLSVAVIDRVRQHVPVADAEIARATAQDAGADCVLVLGGGSAVGLAKAVALTTGLPVLAVPTTYAGSEMTPVWGLTDAGVKTTGRNNLVAPRVVIYDPELTVSLPARLTALSGLNALAHCVDSLWAAGATPLTEIMASRAIAALAEGLVEAVQNGTDIEARSRMLVGTWLAGATFGVAGSSIHHKLCHILGGRFDLPHADTHAALLPWSTRLAVAHLPEAGKTIARALDAPDAVTGIVELETRVDATVALSDLGLSHEDVQPVIDQLDPTKLGASFTVERQELQELMTSAVSGS